MDDTNEVIEDAACQRIVESVSYTLKRSYVPEVPESRKPKKRMEFDSLDEGYQFYNSYAKEGGFSVRSSSNKYDKDRNIIWKMYVCSREGHSNEKTLFSSGQVKRLGRETRDGCGAYMSMKKSGSKWLVCGFIEEHSHMLASPKKAHFLRSHRKMSKVKKSPVDTYSSLNVCPSHQTGASEAQAGGCENMGCIEQDVRNHRRDHWEESRHQDAQMLCEYFKEMKEMNPSFIFNIETDKEGKITHIFWADPSARTSYYHFGDVVSFGTIYDTNCYEMIFAPFTGVNHHGRPVVLGCGFLPNETTESFVWLFQQWLAAMPGEPPKAVMTDQDMAMTRAIAMVLPYACHCYCISHIMQKMFEKLGAAAHKDGFTDTFKDCIHNSEVEEFHIKWKNMLKAYELTDNEWLNSLYDMRAKWIPAYLKDKFFAGMSSILRSEGINAFIKQYVSTENTFYDFILRYEKAVARQQRQELIDDHMTISTGPNLKTPLLMERKMADTYTRTIFNKFQEELFNTMAYTVELTIDNEHESSYMVGPLESDTEKPQLVVYQKTRVHAVCDCHKFEFEGIPCRHVLCVLKHAKIANLPHKYILKRWTRRARESVVLYRSGDEVKSISDDSLLARHSNLSLFFNNIVDEGALSKDAYEFAIKSFTRIQSELRDINSEIGGASSGQN